MKLRFDNHGDYLVAERPSACAYAAFGIKGVAARHITDRRYFYGRRKEETKNVADGILGARSEISLGAGEEKTAYVYILVSHDRKKLDSAVALVSSYGFSRGAIMAEDRTFLRTNTTPQRRPPSAATKTILFRLLLISLCPRFA